MGSILCCKKAQLAHYDLQPPPRRRTEIHELKSDMLLDLKV